MAEQEQNSISFRGLLEFISRILDRVEAKIDGHIAGQAARNVETKSDVTRCQTEIDDLHHELEECKKRHVEWSNAIGDSYRELLDCVNKIKTASGKNFAWKWGMVVAILVLALAILIKGFEAIIDLAPKLIGR
jgi:hypothetical protein